MLTFQVLAGSECGLNGAMLAKVLSEADLGSSPVSSLGVVPDFVISSVSDPVGQRPVLLDLFSQSHFLCEGLDTSHFLLLINNLHS